MSEYVADSPRHAGPRKGDRLFRDDLADYDNNACLNYFSTDGQYGYIEGYRRGALCLVNHVVATGADQDVLVYPIIFLYRHHIELTLKRLMRILPVVLDKNLSKDEKKHLDTHKLDLLWADTKYMIGELATRMAWEQSCDEMDGVDDYIQQLTKMDPDSFSFRYATSRKGASSLPKDLRLINVRHFAEMLERLSSFLGGIEMEATDLCERLADMKADYGG